MGPGAHGEADLEIYLFDIGKGVVGARGEGECLEEKMISHIAFRSTGN